MIVLPGGGKFAIRTPKEISADWMQALINAEVGFASWGIGMQWRCIPCMKSGDVEHALCVGDSKDQEDGTSVFTIECGCTTRAAIGRFTVPAMADPPRERELLDPKRVEHLTPAFMATMDTMERVLKLLDLQFLMRCLRCQMAGRNDGIYGQKLSTSTLTVIECECCRREYRGVSLGVTH